MSSTNGKNNKRKRPGMMSLIITFIPWFIYWALSKSGDLVGSAVPICISLLIVIYRIVLKDIKIIDVISCVYFIASAVVVTIFKFGTFNNTLNFYGSSFLLVFILISLVIKKPFTKAFTKSDSPQNDFNREPFHITNMIITGCWLLFIGFNTFYFKLLANHIALILSGITVIVGTFISVAITFMAPILLILMEFRKYDWSVNIDILKTKGQDEFDAIVIGAGLGGLTSGALLAKRGYKVLVLEHQYHVGGFCSSFQRNGFTFNTGVEDVSGVWEKGSVNALVRELGLVKDDLFIKNSTNYFFKGNLIDIPFEMSELIKVLSDMYPCEKENIKNFLEDAKKAYEECYEDTKLFGTPLPPELISKVFGLKKLFTYPKEYPNFYDWMGKTYRQKLDEYFDSEDLKKIFCTLLVYVGTKAEKTPARNGLAACVSYYLKGGYSIIGGAQQLSESLKDYIEKNGGKVYVNTKVDKILCNNGVVTGVQAKNKNYYSSVVISNVNAKTTFLKLIEEKFLSKKFLKYIKEIKMSKSYYMLFLGVDMDLTDYPVLLKNLDEDWEITINSNADKNLAPSGKSSITVLVSEGIKYSEFPKRETKEYIAKKNEIAQNIINRLEIIIPGISERIIVQEAGTPKTFERYNFMPEGAVYAIDQSIDSKKPFFKTSVKGLYMVGASVFPGAGVEGTIISGMICANDICNWKIKLSPFS